MIIVFVWSVPNVSRRWNALYTQMYFLCVLQHSSCRPACLLKHIVFSGLHSQLRYESWVKGVFVYSCYAKALTLQLNHGYCCSGSNVTLWRLHLAAKTKKCGKDTLCAVSTPNTDSHLHLRTEHTLTVNIVHDESRLCIFLEYELKLFPSTQTQADSHLHTAIQTPLSLSNL